jgi:hypothetical protein
MTVFGQFTREVGADPAGGAGHEGEGTRIAFHDGRSSRVRLAGTAAPVPDHLWRMVRHAMTRWSLRAERIPKAASLPLTAKRRTIT